MGDAIRVMIAEDVQLLLEDMVECINHQADMKVVATATTGREMVELAETIDHDIVLMDIEMETTTAGIIAAEKIRDRDRNEKIIFLTAHETKEMILTAMGTGAIDYIVKGIPEEEVFTHIRNAYNGKSLMETKIQEVIMTEYKRLQQTEKSLLFFINNISNLTPTERELISFLLKKMKIREIANARNVEVVTIKSQINTLLKKFGVSRSKEIVQTIQTLNLTHLF